MKTSKNEFIQEYIDKLTHQLQNMAFDEPENFDQSENDLFDLIIEVKNVFSGELPHIEESMLLRNGTGKRDANSVIGILKLHLINESNVANVDRSDEIIKNTIFISHRSTDKDIVKIFETFLCLCGVPTEKIFVSSLPGNDVKENIPIEVKVAIETSCVQIALLSKQYYESAYCLNEAGIMWYRAANAKTIVIAMPEINENNMIGFLNDDYKIKRLDNRDDLFTIIDIIKTACHNMNETNHTKLNANVNQLIEDYKLILENRVKAITPISPNEYGYYTVEIKDVYEEDGKPHRFYLIKGFLDINEDTRVDESHWICDWNKKNDFKKGDRVKFQVKATTFERFIIHDDGPLYNFRNITPERDIRKV